MRRSVFLLATLLTACSGASVSDVAGTLSGSLTSAKSQINGVVESAKLLKEDVENRVDAVNDGVTKVREGIDQINSGVTGSGS